MSLTGPAAEALWRGGHLAALLVLVGTMGFDVLVLPGAGTPSSRRRSRRVAGGAAALALGLGAAWFLTEAVLLGGGGAPGQVLAAIPPMLAYFGFARLLLVRLGLLALVLTGLAAAPAGWRPLPWLAAAALAVQPWLGHAGAAGGLAGAVLAGAELAHLFAAAFWLGGLPALLGVLRDADDAALAQALRRFSAIGLVAVAAIAAGGVAQAWFLVGGLAPLTGTGYGRAILLKTALFATALILAAVNRFVLTGRLDGPDAATARRRLRVSVRVEAGLGLAIVLTAAWLSGLAPGAGRGTVAALPWPWLPAAVILGCATVLALWLARPAASIPRPSPGALAAPGVAHDRQTSA